MCGHGVKPVKCWIIQVLLSQLVHLPHIIDVNNQMSSSSAFIPLCLSQSRPLGHQNLSFPICSLFKPTFLDGKLCHRLDLQSSSRQRKKKELVLLLDYNAELSLRPNTASSDTEGFYLDTLNSVQ